MLALIHFSFLLDLGQLLLERVYLVLEDFFLFLEVAHRILELFVLVCKFAHIGYPFSALFRYLLAFALEFLLELSFDVERSLRLPQIPIQSLNFLNIFLQLGSIPFKNVFELFEFLFIFLLLLLPHILNLTDDIPVIVVRSR